MHNDDHRGLAILPVQTYLATVNGIVRLLALLALVSSTAMPFGYMPDRSADGSIILRICDGVMPASQDSTSHAMHAADHAVASNMSDAHAAHSEHLEHGNGDHETRCNFAVTTAANIPEAPKITTPLAIAKTTGHINLAALTAIYPPHMPPSTGPPAA